MPIPSDSTTPCFGCGRMVDHVHEDDRERGDWFVVIDGKGNERWYCPLHAISPQTAKRMGLDGEVTRGA